MINREETEAFFNNQEKELTEIKRRHKAFIKDLKDELLMMPFSYLPQIGKYSEHFIKTLIKEAHIWVIDINENLEHHLYSRAENKDENIPNWKTPQRSVPALIHFGFNHGTSTQSGFGIPMATDIAFSLAILSLLGNRVPVALKVFLTALAIIDDLGAITVIAIFYSKGFSLMYFGLAMGLFVVMLILNRLRVYRIWIYLLIGMVMWFFMYRSGIHATITGVLLAFAIPFGKGDKKSISYKLQHRLHLPVAFIILPLFALVNTCISIPSTVVNDLSSENSYGIFYGLLVGKPIGVFLFSMLGIVFGFCALPDELKKRHILWTGFLAGIGFTMSIFITLIAFSDNAIIDASKISVIIGSVIAGALGFIGLRFSLKPLSRP